MWKNIAAPLEAGILHVTHATEVVVKLECLQSNTVATGGGVAQAVTPSINFVSQRPQNSVGKLGGHLFKSSTAHHN